MKFGALHQPDHPDAAAATPYRAIHVGLAPSAPPDWFAACPPDGDAMGNNMLNNCCPVADLRLIQIWLSALGETWVIPRELVDLRYLAVGAWSGDGPGDGTVTQADCFAWQAAPIDAAGRLWPVSWATVAPKDIGSALRRGPLLATIWLTAANQDDPYSWSKAPSGPVVEFHRVVVGAQRGAGFLCRTYGIDVVVHQSLFMTADLMVLRGTDVGLVMAGMDWRRVGL